MAHPSRWLLVSAGAFYVGVGVAVAGALPLLRRTGGNVSLALLLGGLAIVGVSVGLSVRYGRARGARARAGPAGSHSPPVAPPQDR